MVLLYDMKILLLGYKTKTQVIGETIGLKFITANHKIIFSKLVFSLIFRKEKRNFGGGIWEFRLF